MPSSDFPMLPKISANLLPKIISMIIITILITTITTEDNIHIMTNFNKKYHKIFKPPVNPNDHTIFNDYHNATSGFSSPTTSNSFTTYCSNIFHSLFSNPHHHHHSTLFPPHTLLLLYPFHTNSKVLNSSNNNKIQHLQWTKKI